MLMGGGGGGCEEVGWKILKKSKGILGISNQIPGHYCNDVTFWTMKVIVQKNDNSRCSLKNL